MNNLARARLGQDDLQHASSLFKQAFRGLRAQLGPDDPRTLRTLANLGVIRMEVGQVEVARTLLQEVLERERGRVQTDPRQVRLALLNLTECLRVADRPSEAIALIRLDMERLENDPDALSEDLQRGLSLLGAALLDGGRAVEAEAVLKRRLNLSPEGPPNDLALAIARSRLGGALILLNRLDEAVPVLVQADAALRAPNPGLPPRVVATWLIESAQRLTQYYEACSTSEEAGWWRVTTEERCQRLDQLGTATLPDLPQDLVPIPTDSKPND